MTNKQTNKQRRYPKCCQLYTTRAEWQKLSYKSTLNNYENCHSEFIIRLFVFGDQGLPSEFSAIPTREDTTRNCPLPPVCVKISLFPSVQVSGAEVSVEVALKENQAFFNTQLGIFLLLRDKKRSLWQFDFEICRGLISCHGLLFQKLSRLTQNFHGILSRNLQRVTKNYHGLFFTIFLPQKSRLSRGIFLFTSRYVSV